MAVFGRFWDGNGMERYFICLPCLSHRESNIRGPTPMEISMIVMEFSMGSVMEISMGPKEKKHIQAPPSPSLGTPCL